MLLTAEEKFDLRVDRLDCHEEAGRRAGALGVDLAPLRLLKLLERLTLVHHFLDVEQQLVVVGLPNLVQHVGHVEAQRTFVRLSQAREVEVSLLTVDLGVVEVGGGAGEDGHGGFQRPPKVEKAVLLVDKNFPPLLLLAQHVILKHIRDRLENVP